MEAGEAMPALTVTPKIFGQPHPSWVAVATMLLAVTMPVCGWLVSLSNRVAVLESEAHHTATSEQIATLTQKLDDWEAEYHRDQINHDVAAARASK